MAKHYITNVPSTDDYSEDAASFSWDKAVDDLLYLEHLGQVINHNGCLSGIRLS